MNDEYNPLAVVLATAILVTIPAGLVAYVAKTDFAHAYAASFAAVWILGLGVKK